MSIQSNNHWWNVGQSQWCDILLHDQGKTWSKKFGKVLIWRSSFGPQNVENLYSIEKEDTKIPNLIFYTHIPNMKLMKYTCKTKIKFKNIQEQNKSWIFNY